MSCPLLVVLYQMVFSPDVLHIVPLVLKQNLRPVWSMFVISSKPQGPRFLYNLALVLSKVHVFNLRQHYVKSVRIQSYSSPHFSCISHIRTEYGEISPDSVRMRENAGKMLSRITPNKDTFYAVQFCTAESL